MVESYLNKITGFAILLKQNPTTGVFARAFKNFQDRYFLSNTSRRLLLDL